MNDSTTKPRVTRIYVLRDPRNNEIRYVGKTVKKLSYRLSQHIHSARAGKSWYSARWIRTLLREGLEPTIELLEEVIGEGWTEREQYWVAYGRDQGWRLTNTTDGGEGALGYVPSDEQRRKASERQRGENSYHAIFTESQVVEIRERYAAGETGPQLAERFGVTRGAIQNVTRRKNWKHLE